MVIEPLDDRVYVRRDGGWESSQDHGGLEVVQERAALEVGVVEAAGPGKWSDGGRVPMGVQVGDRVLYDRYAGEDHGDDHVVLVLGEVLAVIV